MSSLHAVDGAGRHGNLCASLNETPIVDHQAVTEIELLSLAIDQKPGGNGIRGTAIVLVNEPAGGLFVVCKLRLAYVHLVLLFRHGNVLAIGVDEMSEVVFADVDFCEGDGFRLGR